MSKKAIIVKSVEEAKEIVADAYLLPLKDLSINYQNTFTIEEIKKIKKLNKEVFVFVNKNIENSEIETLKEALIKLDEIEITGIIFYDIAVVELKEELNLKTDLVWHQEHLTTNYGTVNYWYNKGVKYSFLSSELTKREIEEIKKNTKSKLFVNVFGYVPIFTSKRHLVENYIQTFNLDEKGNKIYKERKYYNIEDTKNGTTVYSDYMLNIKEKIDVDYLVYNTNLIKNFNEALNSKEETGFLYKETIYKVK